MNFFHPKYFNRENITKVSLHLVSHLVFWVWNLVFIALMYFWLLPQVGFELIQAARTGEIDPTFTVSFVALMIVPLACTLLGFFRLRKHPILLTVAVLWRRGSFVYAVPAAAVLDSGADAGNGVCAGVGVGGDRDVRH